MLVLVDVVPIHVYQLSEISKIGKHLLEVTIPLAQFVRTFWMKNILDMAKTLNICIGTAYMKLNIIYNLLALLNNMSILSLVWLTFVLENLSEKIMVSTLEIITKMMTMVLPLKELMMNTIAKWSVKRIMTVGMVLMIHNVLTILIHLMFLMLFSKPLLVNLSSGNLDNIQKRTLLKSTKNV